MMNKFLFGPVLSRRLGISLGIDLLPFKFCSYDCVYCECGATTCHRLEREEFFPLAEVRAELRRYLESAPQLDYLTFGGSGEPLLYSRLGELISFLKTEFPPYKVALLTNSSLLPLKTVRAEIRQLDLCVPSLDSATREGFEAIDRPDPAFGLRIDEIIAGIRQTREMLAGEMWLEVFIVPGINDTPRELEALREAVAYIRPHKVQVNSLDRRGSEEWVLPLAAERREEIARFLQGEGLENKTEIFRRHNRRKYLPFQTLKARLEKLLAGGPLATKLLCRDLRMNEAELQEALHPLLAAGVIVRHRGSEGYALPGKEEDA